MQTRTRHFASSWQCFVICDLSITIPSAAVRGDGEFDKGDSRLREVFELFGAYVRSEGGLGEEEEEEN